MTGTRPSGTGSPAGRVRTIIAAATGVIAVLGFTAATIGLWANRTLYDADAFADTIDDVLAQPEVTGALAGYLTDEALRIIPVEGALDDVLPDRLDRAAQRVTGKLRDTVQDQFADLLARPATRAELVRFARASHATLVHTIDTGGVANLKLDDGAVTMNLLPVIVDGIDALPTGALGRALDLPELAYDGDHAEQVRLLSETLGVDLPENTGLITVYRGAAVAQADAALAQTQRGLVVFHRSLTAIIVVTAVALVACLVIAVRRRRALIGLFAGVGVAFGLAGLTLRRAVNEAPFVATDPTNQTVVRAMVRGLSAGLMSLVTVAAVLGFVAAAVIAVVTFGLGRRSRTPA